MSSKTQCFIHFTLKFKYPSKLKGGKRINKLFSVNFELFKTTFAKVSIEQFFIIAVQLSPRKLFTYTV